MSLDPQVRSTPESVRPLYTLSVEEAREADLAAIRAAAGQGEPVRHVTDRHLPGPDGDLPIRIYRTVDTAEPMPTLVYFFGGGWTLGSIETSDEICRALANAVPCQVITVDYRLAPEHKFPAAVNDCRTAVSWIAANAASLGVDPDRLAVAGDSAGGNLAAVTALGARGELALAAQVLVYPNTDHRGETESMRVNDDPAAFNRRSVAWYWSHYLASPDDGRNPLVSPLLAEDLTGLPPALVITAEHDPLRDEGEQYAERLREAGVLVVATRYDGVAHGFFAMSGVVDAAHEARAEVATFLRQHLAVDARALRPRVESPTFADHEFNAHDERR